MKGAHEIWEGHTGYGRGTKDMGGAQRIWEGHTGYGRAIREAMNYSNWDHFREKGPNACFFKISFFFCCWYSENLKCSLHIASYALRIGVSVMELPGSEFLISHAFQRKPYISIARTGNFIIYAQRSLFVETIPIMK